MHSKHPGTQNKNRRERLDLVLATGSPDWKLLLGHLGSDTGDLGAGIGQTTDADLGAVELVSIGHPKRDQGQVAVGPPTETSELMQADRQVARRI